MTFPVVVTIAHVQFHFVCMEVDMCKSHQHRNYFGIAQEKSVNFFQTIPLTWLVPFEFFVSVRLAHDFAGQPFHLFPGEGHEAVVGVLDVGYQTLLLCLSEDGRLAAGKGLGLP